MGIQEGEVTRTVTRRFGELELCLAWGLRPSVWDALPHEERQEMWKFWLWRHERERLLLEADAMGRKWKDMK